MAAVIFGLSSGFPRNRAIVQGPVASGIAANLSEEQNHEHFRLRPLCGPGPAPGGNGWLFTNAGAVASCARKDKQMLIDGYWTGDWHPVQAKDDQGRFQRQASGFRNWITASGAAGATGKAGFRAEAGRYHLYAALICPWASRVLIARKLKRLEHLVSVSIVAPVLSNQGWTFGEFPGADPDPLFGYGHMHQIYTRSAPHYTGRATVPVLWDKRNDCIVSNESADILRMFDTAFDGLAPATPNLFPADLSGEIEDLNQMLYARLNNGVYQSGFATSQAAYREANTAVFEMLEQLETRLAQGGPFLFADRFTESDIRLFVTLIRFDAAYHGLFKTNLRRVADYPSLSAYMERVLHIPGVAATVDMDHIKAGYYSIRALNPPGIVPAGPAHVDCLLSRVGK
jgi:glutathionyl-hydroquinone reductase